uniref:Mediator of RNA polymerase II transcription subunit 14 n=3 Tax=Drosophila melanogaster TaxID=7227 RepID=MED14_DROME|nr:mediator complex subunit 14, isoform A [Drosophila melanogaster]Q9W0P8.4 RecName: Full=Mediator of RNA polymerase II transcription subunit 14; AltName: Full=Mediator complex subunit 14; AltName: Full=dRGR1 [Drosophila melanogaster]AAF47395.4 mediator complex subunit 14, isoform A [Drosophila melanogaster]AGW25608.1 FI21204p1 [Drosophila melanogaster]|eukprot:NP_612041.2 mediator complex subunit 14, isoform A [Drosophila melanogaster]
MAPTPLPLEQMPGVGGGGGGYLPAAQEGGPRINTMSMSVLIDFIIQRTYHELTVLAELLPRKTDMERKVEIYNYAARTRHLFTRLNALVKWGNSVSKVDKSSQIMSFLDKQNMLFVETADMLARMSRETLVRARLPNFHIPAAVEVLTTGTYNRLPTCIRERIVPADAITPAEKRQTLLRLNQVIQHRLVTGKLLPQMREFRIRNGRVTFEVKHEFSVSLTVMGDNPTVPWRLLDIDVLVEDKETGDGKSLVHPLQVNYIHQLIQARLVENPNALSEVYNCLHYFCQSLQLEVLYTQTLRLNYERLDDNNITVEEYVPGVKLTVSYWRDLKSELGYRLTVQSDPSEIGRPLAVVHVPSLGAKESAEVADRAVRSEHLSMERLIVHTVYIRSVSRLSDLKLEFQAFLKDVDFNLQGTPAILTVPVLSPCLRAEQIHITIDTHTGMFRCHVPKHLDCPIMEEMQDCLNGDRSKLPALLSELRFWITHRRCDKTLQHLPATATETLPFLVQPDQEILQPGRHKIYVKLHRHPNIVLVVQLKEKTTMPNEMEYTFHLGFVAYQKDELDVIDDSAMQLVSIVAQPHSDIPKCYTKLMRLIEFDTFVATHGPGTEVDAEVSPHKRKSNGDLLAPPAKQQKTIFPAYFIPELAHVVAMCDEKIPFMNLAQTLSKHNIPHSGLQVEANATSLVLKILALPQPGKTTFATQQQQQQGAPAVAGENKPSGTSGLPKIDSHVWDDLMRRVLSISIRSQTNKNSQVRIWVVEFVFYSTPLQSSHPKEQGSRRTVYLTYEQANYDFSKTVEDLLNDWSKIVYLYTLVYDFAEQLLNKRLSLCDMLVVKSYSYMNLLLGYGPKKEVSCNIYWSVQSHGFRLTFVGGMSAVNGHSMMRDQLAQHLNQQHSITQIAQILHETYNPLSSIAKLPVLPFLGIPRPQVPVLSFCVLAQSPCLIRLTYQAVYCLELRFRANRLVSIRDGASSRFERNVVEEFTPIQGLKAFLSKYVDESAVYRGRASHEDDNPLSPMGMEDNFGGPSSVAGVSAGGSSPFLGTGMRGPQSPRDSGLRFPAPHTPPSSSNPHTPASPHPSAGAGGGSGPQGHGNFNLTSPPAPHMPHPSPSGLMPSSPLNPQPSPHMVHSPGPNTLYMQSHQDSPFTAMSPANNNWPGSPSMPRPSPRPGQSPDHKSTGGGAGVAGGTDRGGSRGTLNRPWAGAVPTLLTHEALETLCRPSPYPNKDINVPDMSPLERFLGCVYMRRQLHRNIQSEETLTALNSTEPGVVLFKVDGLQCQVVLNQMHMQTLHLKVSQLPPMPDKHPPPFQLSQDDLLVIEQYFDTRVAAPPYRPNSLHSICRLLNLPAQVLKDFVQIMRLDLKPELGGDQLKWTVQICLRMPPSAVPIVPSGNACVVMGRMKILFFLQITRIPYGAVIGVGKDWKDSPSLVLPIVYDIQTNVTQLAERTGQVISPTMTAASTLLRRFAEFNAQQNQCTLFPAITDLLTNLQLAAEMPQPPPNQSIGPPVGVGVGVGSSPNPMMPMQQLPQQVGPQGPVGPGGYPQMGPNPGGPQ